ncbi:MAG: hypothetical protein PHY14_04535 [Candidatus Gracilibacteria bacterium]|nr:hypothetical protein [Candidatus Gracilibacteria bacterium]
MLTINSLDLLFLVMAIMAIPIGTLLTMILWRIYCMLERAEKVLDFSVRMMNMLQHWEKIPMMILEKFLGK